MVRQLSRRAVVLALVVGAGVGSVRSQGAVDPTFTEQRAVVTTYCFDCHGGDVTKGKFDLAIAAGDPVDRLFRLSRMRARLASHEMPPSDADQPTPAERQALLAWLDRTLAREVPELPPAPGRVTVRRLNSSQWARTVDDLFGVAVDTSAFPPDDLGYGFDTVGDAMEFSTLHLEKYLAAAGAVAAAVFTGEDPDNPTVRRFEAETMKLARGPGAGLDGEFANLYTRALLEQVFELPRDGRFRLRVSAGASQAGDELARLRVSCDGAEIATVEVPERKFGEHEFEVELTGGRHRLGLAFVNDYYDPRHPNPRRRDRNLYIDWAEVAGPLDPRAVPPQQAWVHRAVARQEDAEAQLRDLVRVLLPRVWRRPVTATERRRYFGVGRTALAAGEPDHIAWRAVVQAALTSPNFLFRGELGGVRGEPGASANVPALALAARLSYFLWASAPDSRLYQLGRTGKLADARVLRAEALRMLGDARADSLATEFAAQWLELANLRDATPDPERFGVFDEHLRRSLRRETELVFLAIQRGDRDVRDLLDCDFSFVDARLAEFYGMPVPEPEACDADGFARVKLPAALRRRGGVLGHASILALTSNPTRTSPVKRGKWILENLLGAPPPPPPPGNDSLPDEGAIDSSKTFREQLAQHREDSKCAVCHVRMDALGLALERFDAIGRFRERDAGGVIDTSGELPGGLDVDGLVDVKAVLRGDPAFVRTLARKLFVYGIGRDPRPVDRLTLDHAVDQLLLRERVTLADLVLAIITSDAFRLREVERSR
ncbi:MAG: DUF1592 domain-containing protein [bacterium]|nr:DUF1592 domain-containing protein [bacterium]